MSPEAIAHLCSVDKHLAVVIESVGPCGLVPKKQRTPYEGLVRAVANQQLSGKAAATILARFIGLFPASRFPAPRQVLSLEDDQLTAVGFSRAKARYIKAIAQATVEGLVPGRKEVEHLTDEEIVERLTPLPGIGRWSVEMFLMFGLGRPDVLPVHDLGIQNGFALVYRLRKPPTTDRILKQGKIWQPYRTTAAWYLWRAIDLHREARGLANAARPSKRGTRGKD